MGAINEVLRRRAVVVVTMISVLLGGVPLGLASAEEPSQPCTARWTGAAGTNRFEDAANWDTGNVPGSSDVACVEGAVAGGEITYGLAGATELVALRADAPVRPVERSGRPRWLHHGSSISQGSNATGPTSTWPSVAAALTGADLTNLGLGGSALLDPFVARTLRDLPADVVSVKLGINVVNADTMRMRAFGPAVHGFLDTIREGHPDVPLLVATPLFCPIHEDTPGPGGFDLSDGTLRFVATGDPAEVAAGRLTLRTVRGALTQVVESRRASDPHLHLVDGLGLYGPADHDELPLPDRLHLDTAGHRRVGERFAEVLRPYLPTAP